MKPVKLKYFRKIALLLVIPIVSLLFMSNFFVNAASAESLERELDVMEIDDANVDREPSEEDFLDREMDDREMDDREMEEDWAASDPLPEEAPLDEDIDAPSTGSAEGILIVLILVAAMAFSAWQLTLKKRRKGHSSNR